MSQNKKIQVKNGSFSREQDILFYVVYSNLSKAQKTNLSYEKNKLKCVY